MPLYDVQDSVLQVHLHQGQTIAWDALERFIFVIAGTQSGKTSFGPLWLDREMDLRGPGDYLVVAPTYDLFKLKVLPEVLYFFKELQGGWTYHKSDRVLSRPGYRVVLRSANVAEGLESVTAKAAWLDECGQPSFRLNAWEAVLRRLAINEGRVLGTTTPYNMGWLKLKIHDPWKKGNKNIRVVNFRSIDNPDFPQGEWERAKHEMPYWRFMMFYNGIFVRPPGLIYDNFGELDVTDRFPIPSEWPKYMGLDFGGANTVALYYAQRPGTTQYYLYKAYKAGSKTIRQHVEDLSKEPVRKVFGGGPAEDQWRTEFRDHGMVVLPPDQVDVEIGISRVYAGHANHQILVFSDMDDYLEEKALYSRKLDAGGEPTEEIEDKKSYHYMDAERYVMGSLIKVKSGKSIGRWGR